MKNITFDDLNIPESLNQWYIDHDWQSDYYMELPIDWESWTDKQLNQYPITCEVVQWRKAHNSAIR